MYGADSVRLFILSDSPPEKDVQWSEQGIISSYKFIQKLFLLDQKIKTINKKTKKKSSTELSKFINQFLNKIEKNLSNFHYNVIIANIHEAYSHWIKLIKDEENFDNLIIEYSKFLISISPVLPHLTSECLNELNIENLEWPKIDEKYLIEKNVKIVVQFNGKKRGTLDAKKDIQEEDLIKDIVKSRDFDKYLKGKKIKRHVYIKNRLINFLI